MGKPKQEFQLGDMAYIVDCDCKYCEEVQNVSSVLGKGYSLLNISRWERNLPNPKGLYISQYPFLLSC